MYPRQSPTTHTEQLGEEASVYDWARAQVHALNPTAARVWRQCDGATSPDAIAAALRQEMGIPEADAVVDLTLVQLARLHLLELPEESRGDRPATTRRWLLGRGVAAAMLPAIYSIVAPSPVEAQSPGAGAPTLASISPNQGIRGTTVAVTLTGARFVAGATTVAVSGAGVTVNNIIVGSTTSLTANFVLDPTAATDARTVTVTTAAGTSGAQTFTITLPAPGAPTLTSIAPNQGIRGGTVAVTLTGTNFVVGATTVNIATGGVTVNTVVVGSTTSLTANFVLDAAATEGPRTVTVTTAGGTSAAQTFTITLPAPGAPTLTSVVPNQGILGTTVAVTLTGTNFVGATTVAVSGTGVTVTGVTVSSSTSLTASFVLDAAAALGARNVTVTTASGTSGSQTFTVNPPTPTLTSVEPIQGTQGTTVAVTLTGTNFVAGATVAVSGTGVTVNTIVVGSSTSLTANFVLDSAAAAGARTVTVTTPGGTSGGQTFTINPPAPTLVNVSPNQGTKGTTATTVAVTLTGTNFVSGATVAVSGTGVTVNPIVIVNSTTLTTNFAIDPAAAAGARTVTVTTSGGTSGAQTFTVNAASQTFAFTGSPTTFVVPPGVTTLTVIARGAQGGTGGSAGGQGGSVAATLPVVSGDTLNVRVAGQGGANAAGAVGGFNGGGAGGIGNFRGGGGGASDIRRGGDALPNRVLVAGGGGGGSFTDGDGGAGGGTAGADGRDSFFPPSGPTVTGGGGGTPIAGGSPGTNSLIPGNNGLPGVSGIGGNGGPGTGSGAAGGGGGGGYFGGGGGAGASVLAAGAGGGGSSFADPTATGVVHTQGGRTGDGEVTISW